MFGTKSKRNAGEPTTDATVRVRGGYRPDTVVLAAGEPARITFRREETAPCSEQVVFPAFGKAATLPVGEDVVVELPAAEPGEYDFTCGMQMLRGTLVVRERESA